MTDIHHAAHKVVYDIDTALARLKGMDRIVPRFSDDPADIDAAKVAAARAIALQARYDIAAALGVA